MCGPPRPGAEKMATRTVNIHGMSRHLRDASTPSSKSGLSVSMIARAHLCESARGSRRVRLPRLPWRETISARTRWCKAGSADVGLPAQCHTHSMFWHTYGREGGTSLEWARADHDSLTSGTKCHASSSDESCSAVDRCIVRRRTDRRGPRTSCREVWGMAPRV